MTAQRVGLHKLLGAGRTLVLQLRVVLHLVAGQLVQAGHHRGADRAGDVQPLLPCQRGGDVQPFAPVGRIVDSKVGELQKDLRAAPIVAGKGGAAHARLMAPEVVGAGKGLPTLGALEGLVQRRHVVDVLPKLFAVHEGLEFEAVADGLLIPKVEVLADLRELVRQVELMGLGSRCVVCLWQGVLYRILQDRDVRGGLWPEICH